LVVLISSCNKKVPITITKVEGSPEYENAKLSLDSIYQKDKNELHLVIIERYKSKTVNYIIV